jgi:iron complex outermembrane recepter protein
MKVKTILAVSAALLACVPNMALAQDTAPVAADDVAQSDGDIIVTARKREESLKDVPVAATAITGDTIEKRGFTSVREIAQLTPSLNINSDGAGRAFVSIRGVGTTLIDTVQPGVGIFVDGIYQPNTSYLNNPLTDVERVEVLRGPQGTLYGKNTLGGAINVITRQPGNEFEGKVIASYAGPDNAWTAGGSISGPIIQDRLQARLAFVHQEQEGFIRNTLLNADQNPLNTDTISATVRVMPADDVNLTINGYYTWLTGGAVPYTFVSNPQDYKRDLQLNSTNYQVFKYRGVNAKLDFPIDALSSTVTLIAAYDRRGVVTSDSDPDFTQANTLRSSAVDDLKTRTAELRLDSELSSTLSSIFGLFYSRETRKTDQDITILPGIFNFLNNSLSNTESDTYAAFGTMFWRPTDAWELSAGLRWDRQERVAAGLQTNQFPVPGTVVTGGIIKETTISPRVALTHHVNSDLMVYGSVARGARGGGFNPPAVPQNLRTYKGDSAWVYELGTKYASPDRNVSLAVSLFYNDYKDYLGLNSILRTGPSFTTIDLNTGDIESYGIELEGVFRVTPQWTLSGGGSLMHARLTNTDIYTQTTGRTLASNRLSFQPDWNFSLNSDYVVPVGDGSITLNANLVGKGSRIPASIRQITPEFPGHPELTPLSAYVLANGSITYRIGGIEVGAFVNNAFNKKYYESYIERTTLVLAGLPNSDVGIMGDRRRYGIRTRITF